MNSNYKSSQFHDSKYPVDSDCYRKCSRDHSLTSQRGDIGVESGVDCIDVEGSCSGIYRNYGSERGRKRD
jgi:hypothetical protein